MTMFFTLGRSKRAPGDVVDGLIECHGRIRKFIELAISLSERVDVPAADVTVGCTMIGRYFSVTFPLHVEDEERSILPRLQGRSASLDAALARVHEQHDVHESMLERFCALTAAVRNDPRDPRARSALASIARPLKSVLCDHLDAEEQIVFPVIREAFSAHDFKAVRREIEARRDRADIFT